MKNDKLITSGPQPLANPLNVFNQVQNEVVTNRFFSETTVSGTLLSHTQFSGCHFDGCAFFSSQLSHVEFVACTFSNCNFWYIDFENCNFIACTFNNCSWDSCTNLNCNLISCSIDHATAVNFLKNTTSMEGCFITGPNEGPYFKFQTSILKDPEEGDILPGMPSIPVEEK